MSNSSGPMSGSAINARAPGKVVLWGEYAVLAGAPALVMGVDRHALCSVSSAEAGWKFEALGFQAPSDTVSRTRLLSSAPPAPDGVWRLVWHVLRHLDTAQLPDGGSVRLDTRGFHHQGCKLGLGSSAALSVAVYGAFCRLLGQRPSYAGAMDIHHTLQGGAGSGIDVAAAWQGGTLRFQRDSGRASACPWDLPPALRRVFVWTGASASTVDHLAKFRRWRDAGSVAPLEALATCSRNLFETTDLLAGLTDYVTALESLDAAADLGIYSEPHRSLRRLAIEAGVVYKPCGAGGGDLGAAFSLDEHAVERFSRLAAERNFPTVPLETAPHGLEVTG